MWALAAGFAISALSGILSADQQGAQEAAQYKAQAARTQQGILEAGQTASALNAQAGALSGQATAQLNEATRLADIQSGQQTANAGAAGVRGASVDAVQNDIQLTLARTEQATLDDLAVQQFNLRQQAVGAYRQVYLGSNVASPVSSSSRYNAALVGAATRTGGQYAQQYFQFGSSTGNQATGGR